MVTLYQFKCSHYCEKAAWALDYKGIQYRTRNLVPGPSHIATIKKITGGCTEVPLMVDGNKVIQGSGQIISYLDQHYTGPQLSPEDENHSQEVMEWEAYLDRELGESLRLWFYFHTLPDRRKTTAFMLQGAPWYGYLLYAVIYSSLREKMTRLMNINPDSSRIARDNINSVLDKLNRGIEGRQYLVGDRFTRADLTASAMLSPIFRMSSDILTPSVSEFWRACKNEPCVKWAAELYRHYRNTKEVAR